jgi:hypothetical protein
MFEFIKNFWDKYERRISSLALIGGFIFDNLTLERIDLLYENLVTIFYLILSGGGIILINYLEENPPQKEFLEKVKNIMPLFIQFAFGGLFSAYFVFYSRSASFSSSLPFVLILLGLLIGNEFFKERYKRMVFRTSVYFLAIYSFSIFFLPILFNKIGPSIFLISGIVSLLVIYLFILLLSKITPVKYKQGKRNLKNSIVSLFVLINVLYFLNLIPPIPLSLKDAGAYYSVERIGGNYEVLTEELSWYRNLFSTKTLHLKNGENAYVFSAVFAPTDLNTNIVHNWQYFDEVKNKWISSSKISFPIRGGAGGGYRGFSKKSSVREGRWRVNIETERGQIIGRVWFDIEVNGEYKPELVSEML